MKKQVFNTEYNALFFDENDVLIESLLYNNTCCNIEDAISRVYETYEEKSNEFSYAEVEIQVTEYEEENEVLYALDTVTCQTLLTFKNGKFTGLDE